MTRTLQKCPMGEHESWASFPKEKYKRILVHVAFLTAMGSVLIVQDAQGRWILPREEFKCIGVLLSVPDRVIERELALQPSQLRAPSFRRQPLILGSHDDGGGELHVFLRVPAHFMANQRYVAGFEDLKALGSVDSTLPLAADRKSVV